MSTDANQNERLRDHDRRITAIEYNLKLVMAQLRIDWQEPPMAHSMPQEAIDLLARGDKLRAIQVLVTKLGLSLTDAKAMVDGKR
jgi:ribosomal protein L7/L12